MNEDIKKLIAEASLGFLPLLPRPEEVLPKREDVIGAAGRIDIFAPSSSQIMINKLREALIAVVKAHDELIAKLQKTEDGVPIVPGMELWLVGPDVSKSSPDLPGVLGRCNGVYDGQIRFNGCLYPKGTTFYSTAEAAALAPKGSGSA